MNSSIARGFFAGAVLGAALSGGHSSAPQAQSPADPAYAVRYLGSLGGGNSRGNSINNAGWIAGYSNLDGDTYRHAALWTENAITDLGTLGRPDKLKNSNVAWPVKNTRGLIVGISQTDSPDPWGENWSCAAFFVPATSTGYRCLGFVWENGSMRLLPTLGGTHGYAAAANNAGQIVGWAENTTRDKTCTPPQVFQFRAVIWGPSGKQIHQLPVLPGDTSSAATAINDKGQVVGISGTCDDALGGATAAHAVLWDNGRITDIGNLGGDEWNTPTAINENGDIAGFSDHPGDLVTEAFLWTREGGLKPLGFLPGHENGLSEAFGMNNRRQVVGLSCSPDFSDCRAFLWQDGVMRDLNELAAVAPGDLLTHAMDINDDGVITGRAFTAGGMRPAFVATPSSASALAAARGAGERPRVSARLDAAALREILHPLGPGRSRLEAMTR